MNRLRLQPIYLCGPMDYDRETGKIWRDDLFEWLELRNAIPIDPYNKPLAFDESGLEDDDSAAVREAAMAAGDYAKVREIVKPIRGIDLRMVDASCALVTNLDLEKQPCGTYEESFVSNRSKKPNIIMCPQGIKKIPDWMFGVLPYQFFFDTWGQVKEYLRHIDEDEDIDTLGRWRFFDFEPQIMKVLKKEGWSKNRYRSWWGGCGG